MYVLWIQILYKVCGWQIFSLSVIDFLWWHLLKHKGYQFWWSPVYQLFLLWCMFLVSYLSNHCLIQGNISKKWVLLGLSLLHTHTQSLPVATHFIWNKIQACYSGPKGLFSPSPRPWSSLSHPMPPAWPAFCSPHALSMGLFWAGSLCFCCFLCLLLHPSSCLPPSCHSGLGLGIMSMTVTS